MTSEPSFRAQLVLPDQRNLYDLWCQRAGARQMPARGDFDPADLRAFLPRVGLIDVACDFDTSRVRLAGTGLKDIYGCELTGLCLGQVPWGRSGAYWRRIFDAVTDKCAPRQGAVRGPARRRGHLVMFWLRLPLSDDGETVNKVMTLDTAFARSARQTRQHVAAERR